jgi:hypothetical protein
MVMCWECGAETGRPLTAMFALPSGPRRSFELCPRCYREHYVPLIVETISGGEPEAISTLARAVRGGRAG